MLRRGLLLTFAIILLTAGSPALPTTQAQAAEHQISFDDALAQAKEQDSIVVIDFFTDWCIYCKHFDRDLADAETGIAEALEEVVFTSIDAEKGEGIELAKRYGVTGFPTYVVIDDEGELIDRWSGYGGPDHFLGELKPAVADAITVGERKARFAKSPTADDAETLAEFAAAEGDHARAIELLQNAEELDPERELSGDIAYVGYRAWRADEDFAAEHLAELLAENVDEESSDDAWMMSVALLDRAAGAEEKPDLRKELLRRALAHAESKEDFDPASKKELEVLGLLHVDGDKEQAAALQKETLPEGWRDDPNALNAYAWWCFENDVNLAEAEKLARRGIELAEPGSEKAMILDTAAEICNARGDGRDAVTLMERAIEEDPGNEHYREQLERFRKNVAQAGK